MRSERAEPEAKLRVFLRLLISYNDFQQASWIASYILAHRLQEKVERLRGRRQYRIRLLWQALNSAMVVSYCRPFSANDRRSARPIPDLPKRFLRALSREERELHRVAMTDRNTMLAHSDSDAWDLRSFFMEAAPGHKILLPLHNDTRAPLVHDAVERLQGMCGKLMRLVFAERKRLEKELADFLPTLTAAELSKLEDEGGG
jgi:hypothetical protein